MTEHFDTASPLSAAPKRPLKVFLCHAHSDKDAVKALYTRLTQDGVDAWLDKEKLLPGQDWELEIRKAVREADVVVVCLSKQFNQAGFRQKEVKLALDTAMEKPEGEIFIIPARLEECENLESLRRWHEVNLFDEDGYDVLLKSINARAKALGVQEPSRDVNSDGLKVVDNGSGMLTTKIRLQTKNLETVFAFLQDRLHKINPNRLERTKIRDEYPDGIARTVTYSETLMLPNRVGNKIVVKSNYSIIVFPGKTDVNAMEMIEMHQSDAIVFTGWEAQTVFLELEYAQSWHEAIKKMLIELYDLFGRFE